MSNIELECPNHCMIRWSDEKEDNEGHREREEHEREAIMRKKGKNYVCEKCGYHIRRSPIIAEMIRRKKELKKK